MVAAVSVMVDFSHIYSDASVSIAPCIMTYVVHVSSKSIIILCELHVWDVQSQLQETLIHTERKYKIVQAFLLVCCSI